MKLSASQSLSAVFGVLMATAPTLGSHGITPVTAVIALLAVLVVLAGLFLRPAATLAVLLAGAVIVLSDPPPILAALSGLCAGLYLVLRHAGAVTTPTAVGIAGFGFAGLVATAFPLSMPWVPLLAPLAVVGVYVLAIRPFLGGRRRASDVGGGVVERV